MKQELKDAQVHVVALGAGFVIAELVSPLLGKQADPIAVSEVVLYGACVCLVLWLREKRLSEEQLEHDAADDRPDGRADDRGGDA